MTERKPRPLICALCGAADGTVAQTIVRDGAPWPPTCGACTARVREKSARIAAVQRVEGFA